MRKRTIKQGHKHTKNTTDLEITAESHLQTQVNTPISHNDTIRNLSKEIILLIFLCSV